MLHPSGRCIFSITFGVPGWAVQSSARLNVFGWVGARSNELKDEATFLRSLRRRFFESRYKPEASHHEGRRGDHAEASSKINKELSADQLTSRRSTRIPHRSICSERASSSERMVSRSKTHTPYTKHTAQGPSRSSSSKFSHVNDPEFCNCNEL